MSIFPDPDKYEQAGEKLVDKADTMLDTQRVDLFAAIEKLLQTKKITILIEDRDPK